MAPVGASNMHGPSSENTLTFEVDLRKSANSRLGIDVVLVSSPQGCGLVVERVAEDGAVEAWNRRSREPMRIRPGDFIIQVNGVEGEISFLAAELRSAGDVRITVQRPDAENASSRALREAPQSKRQAAPPAAAPPAPGQTRSAPLDMMNSASAPAAPPASAPGGPAGRNFGGGGLGAVMGAFPGPVGAYPGDVRILQGPGAGGPGGGSGGQQWSDTGPGFQYVGVPGHMQGPNPGRGQWGGQPPQWPGRKAGARAIMGDPSHDALAGPETSGMAPPPSGGSRLAGGFGLPDAPSASDDALALGDDGTSRMFGHHGPTSAPPRDGQFTFDVNLTKSEHTRLGIDVMTHRVTEVSGLTIKRISKGCVVDEWNQSGQSPHQVCPGDCIVKVNGVSEDYALMWQELRSNPDIRMTILRRESQLAAFAQMQDFEPVALPANQGRGGMRKALADAGRPALTDGSGAGAGAISIPMPNMGQNFGGGNRMLPPGGGPPPITLPGQGGVMPRDSPDLSGIGLAAPERRSAPGPQGIPAFKGMPPDAPSLSLEVPGPASLTGGGKGGKMEQLEQGKGASPPASDLGKTRPTPQWDEFPRGPGNNVLIAGPSAASLGDDLLRFDVVLQPAKDKRVGMDVILVSGKDLCGFVVECIKEDGRVDAWNKLSRHPYKVQIGDYIISVNGVGDWKSLSKMSQEFATESKEVRFTIQRGPPGLLQHQGVRKILQQAAEKAAEKSAVTEAKRQENRGQAMLKPTGVPPGLQTAGSLGMPSSAFKMFGSAAKSEEEADAGMPPGPGPGGPGPGGPGATRLAAKPRSAEPPRPDGPPPPPTGLGSRLAPPPPAPQNSAPTRQWQAPAAPPAPLPALTPIAGVIGARPKSPSPQAPPPASSMPTWGKKPSPSPPDAVPSPSIGMLGNWAKKPPHENVSPAVQEVNAAEAHIELDTEMDDEDGNEEKSTNEASFAENLRQQLQAIEAPKAAPAPRASVPPKTAPTVLPEALALTAPAAPPPPGIDAKTDKKEAVQKKEAKKDLEVKDDTEEAEVLEPPPGPPPGLPLPPKAGRLADATKTAVADAEVKPDSESAAQQPPPTEPPPPPQSSELDAPAGTGAPSAPPSAPPPAPPGAHAPPPSAPPPGPPPMPPPAKGPPPGLPPGLSDGATDETKASPATKAAEADKEAPEAPKELADASPGDGGSREGEKGEEAAATSSDAAAINAEDEELLSDTLKLDDAALTTVLKDVLAQKPWLRARVSHAVGFSPAAEA